MTWQVFARRTHAPLSARVLQEGQQAPHFEAATGIPFDLRNHIWLDETIYLRADEVSSLRDTLRKLIPPDDWGFLGQFTVRCAMALKNLTSVAERVSRTPDIVAAQPPDLERYFSEWMAAYRQASAFIPVFRTIDQQLSQYVDNGDLAELFSGASGLVTEESSERAELAAMANALRVSGDLHAESPEASVLIQGHVDRYGWLGMRWYLGSPLGVQDVQRRLLVLLTRAQVPTQAPRHRDRPAADWRKPVIEQLAYLRSHRAEAINKAIWTMLPFFKALASRFGLGYMDLVYMLPHEVVGCLRGDAPPAALIGRRESFGSVLLEGSFQNLAGRSAVDGFARSVGITSRSETTAPSADVLLRGVPACPGRAVGRVKLVRTDADGARLVDGEILVTVMTYPSMVGSMQRAAAIVTDDGGLLSHAAVTARELEKPCLIDTGNATQVLADGDMVEVDCDAGYVRRIA